MKTQHLHQQLKILSHPRSPSRLGARSLTFYLLHELLQTTITDTQLYISRKTIGPAIPPTNFL